MVETRPGSTERTQASGEAPMLAQMSLDLLPPSRDKGHCSRSGQPVSFSAFRRGGCTRSRVSSNPEKQKMSTRRRRTGAEVQQLVAEFLSSGMRRSEFCRSRELSFGTLNRHLKNQRWKKKSRRASLAGQLVPVDLVARKSPTQYESSCGLAVVLSGGRRIEVHPDFDANTFERLVSALERV